MNRHQHTSNNDVLLPPPGVPITDVCSLPITRIQWSDGEHGVVSFWTPTPEELKLLAQGKPVRLSIIGKTHPPIMLGVDGDGVMQL